MKTDKDLSNYLEFELQDDFFEMSNLFVVNCPVGFTLKRWIKYDKMVDFGQQFSKEKNQLKMEAFQKIWKRKVWKLMVSGNNSHFCWVFHRCDILSRECEKVEPIKLDRDPVVRPPTNCLTNSNKRDEQLLTMLSIALRLARELYRY